MRVEGEVRKLGWWGKEESREFGEREKEAGRLLREGRAKNQHFG